MDLMVSGFISLFFAILIFIILVFYVIFVEINNFVVFVRNCARCGHFFQLTIARVRITAIDCTDDASSFEVEKSVLAGRFESSGYAYIKEHGLLRASWKLTPGEFISIR